MAKEITWRAGDMLYIRAHTSDVGKGLSYTAGFAVAMEDGVSGGWDVWDGTNSEGDTVSFYGFSVERVAGEAP